MKKIVYYVASSIDGFISGEKDDISGFVAQGNGVEKYLEDLKSYETVIMGRNTYEFGYRYGLVAGKLAYPHMEHFIFSKTISFEQKDENLHVVRDFHLSEIKKIKAKATTDIYLCGGGAFAGWLLDNELIDELKLKVNPFIQGKGVKLFGDSTKVYQLNLISTKEYDEGLLINSYKIIY
ncbi:MAG: dihydrofolate reductase family protein [Saprospiraceae bacterium]|nr:dihydrofolate reductase family protein [Saprospiraceae bacterium]